MERYTKYIENWEEVQWAREKLEQKTKKELIDIIMKLAEDVEDLTIQRDDAIFESMVARNWWF